MISFTLPNGVILARGTPFSFSGIQYPANWLELATADDLLARGIVEVHAPDPDPNLSDIKAELQQRVHGEFEAACAEIVTPGAAMANVYRVQSAEAEDYNAKKIAGQPLPAVPSLSRLVGILAPSLDEVVSIVLERMLSSEVALADLNAKRIKAKQAILAAPDAATARAAAIVTW